MNQPNSLPKQAMKGTRPVTEAPNPAVLQAIAAAPLAATLQHDHQGWHLTLTRSLAADPATLWPLLTVPDQLARWSPIVPDRPLTSVGPATSREHPTTPPVAADVVACNPPTELIHHWGELRLRWHLAPQGNGTHLILEHTFADRNLSSYLAAGWHGCLAVLDVISSGGQAARVVGEDAYAYGWHDLQTRYNALLNGQE